MSRSITPQERQLLRVIKSAGGSICPGLEVANRFSSEGRKSLRWMAANGFLIEETFDDGPTFTLTPLGREEAENGH